MINLPKFQRKLVYLILPRSFKLFSDHSCQVVHHRAPKLPGTGNTFNSSTKSIAITNSMFNFGKFFTKNAITFDLTKIERKKLYFIS